MVLNYIWIGFFLVGFLIAIIRLLAYISRDFWLESFGWVFTSEDINVFQDMVQATFDMSKTAMTILIPLAGVMTFWLGLLKIAEKAGLIEKISLKVSPVLSKLFPEVPKGHPAMGNMMMNFSANLLGLGNAATPLGLKAMEDLQELNPKKDTASNAQIMFLVLNTSGLTMIPLSVIATRMIYNSASPAEVFIPILLATMCSTFVGMFATSIAQKINLFQKNLLLFLGGLSVVIAMIITGVSFASKGVIEQVSAVSGNLILFSIICFILILGWKRKMDVYSTFIEGAKEGFQVIIRIIPYLVAMLVGIGVFRASGALDLITDGLANFFQFFSSDVRFTDALPVGIMRPFSGGGAEAMMIDTMKTFGVDSFEAKTASLLQGSTETTFYVLAVYFGSVGIKNTRNAALLGLIADLAGVIAAISMAYIFFA